MDENSLRSALGAIASDIEPPATTTIDIAAARRRGRRRQRAVRIVTPVAIALAVFVAVTIPFRLTPSSNANPSSSNANPSVPATPSVPGRFDPMVVYADFGWLPPGFAEAPALFSAEVTPYSLNREARGPNEMLGLGVNVRGQCGPPGSNRGSLCYGSGPFTTLAPLNGRPAWGERDRSSFTSAFIWEYAPGAFASVGAGMVKFTHSPLSFAVLREVAARVKFEPQRMTFPFRLTGVPAGWQVWGVRGWASLSNVGCDVSIDVGPASDHNAVELRLWQPAASQAPGCKGRVDPIPGKRVTKYGVAWYYYPPTGRGKYRTDGINSVSPAGAAAGFGIGIVVHVPSPYGDAFGVFHQMTLLGTNPANWTTRPLG